jgi:X-X-X-Leu-X-X-Gly heptad repeat protein
MIDLLTQIATTGHHLLLASENPAVGNAPALNGASALSGTSALTDGVTQLVDTVSKIAAPFAILGSVWGGVVHTQVFHNERAPEQGKQILKMSLIGLGVVIFAPLMVNGLVGIS